MKRKSTLMVAVMVSVCAAALVTWKDSLSTIITKQTGGEVMEDELQFRPVPTVRVREASREISRIYPGSVRADNRVELSFSVDGLLKELNIREGERVSKGELLARLDPRDFRNALDASKARYNDAKRALERAEDLYRRKSLARAKYDSALTSYEVAAADLRVKEKALEDTVIYAPFDGVVSKRYVENREHVKARAAILGFKDISMIQVVIHVPEKIMAREGVQGFSGIKVRFDADETRWHSAAIKEYSVQSDPVSRTYELVVAMAEPEGLEIFPGMTASVSLSFPRPGTTRSILLAPVEAVVGGKEGKSFVWVIPEQGGSPRKIEVVPGAITDHGVEILDGLQGNERIAVAGVHTLLEDMEVRPARVGKEGLDV